MIAAGPYCQRACCEGTKKPIGWFHPTFVAVSTAIDALSLGRPPSWRRAEPRPTRPRGSIHFVMFFEIICRSALKSFKISDLTVTTGGNISSSPPKTTSPPTPQRAVLESIWPGETARIGQMAPLILEMGRSRPSFHRCPTSFVLNRSPCFPPKPDVRFF